MPRRRPRSARWGAVAALVGVARVAAVAGLHAVGADTSVSVSSSILVERPSQVTVHESVPYDAPAGSTAAATDALSFLQVAASLTVRAHGGARAAGDVQRTSRRRHSSMALSASPNGTSLRRRRSRSRADHDALRSQSSFHRRRQTLKVPKVETRSGTYSARGRGGHTGGDGESGTNGIVLNHLAKCGGTLVKWVMNRSLPGTQVTARNEVHELTKLDVRGRSFVIGLIRNPFDYYVSLWAYTAEQGANGQYFRQALDPRAQANLYPERRQGQAYGEDESDVMAFRHWLRAISDSHVGLLTMRFYGHYLDQERAKNLRDRTWNMQTAAHALNDHPHLRDKMLRAMESFNATRGPVSCWVQSENIDADTRTCLTHYEAEVGGGVVDWAMFNASVPLPTFNKSPHRPCSVFYDQESQALVAHLDRGILRAFGYPAHCHDDSLPSR